jgi:hypothetical protein
MAAFADPFDSLLISDMDIFAPPAAADAAGQKDFDPMNPGSPVATVKARVSTLGRSFGREFKSDKKVALAHNVVFMRPYAGLTEKHWLRVAGVFYNILGIDDPGLMGHHYECYVQVVFG